MTEIHEMTNSPVEIELRGKKYKVRSLSLEDIFSTMESLAISDRINQMMEIAEHLKGEEKMRYLREATQDLPSGEELRNLVQGKMQTMTGISRLFLLAIKEDQPEVTVEQVKELLGPEEIEKVSGLIEWLCGLSKKKPQI